MTKDYQPELGQACFGQPWKRFECPRYVEAALTLISEELQRVGGNVYGHDVFANPFSNSGGSFTELFEFQVHAYSWADEEQPFNFRYGDWEVSWYKYLGRGMSMNRETSPLATAKMIDVCIEALQRFEEKKLPHLY